MELPPPAESLFPEYVLSIWDVCDSTPRYTLSCDSAELFVFELISVISQLSPYFLGPVLATARPFVSAVTCTYSIRG